VIALRSVVIHALTAVGVGLLQAAQGIVDVVDDLLGVADSDRLKLLEAHDIAAGVAVVVAPVADLQRAVNGNVDDPFASGRGVAVKTLPQAAADVDIEQGVIRPGADCQQALLA
jgi:hypothetical protein